MVSEPNENQDPMDAAMDAEYTPRTLTFFGNMAVDTFYCVLVKGQGKILFDPTQHSMDKRFTSISFILDQLPSTNRNGQPIQRDMIAESKEWSQIVKPSLTALNNNLRGVHNKWVQIQLIPTGEKYTNKDGVEKLKTSFKFMAIYPDQQSCQAAADAFFSKTEDNSQPAQTSAAPADNGTVNPERKTAQAFLPALWVSSGKDPIKFASVLANTPPVNKYFSIESPEVLAVMAPAA